MVGDVQRLLKVGAWNLDLFISGWHLGNRKLSVNTKQNYCPVMQNSWNLSF